MKSETKKKKETRLTNPNGVNQYTEPDPRQALFLSLYLDEKSPTFGNAYQSALSAKYSDAYAQHITSVLPEWLAENMRRRSFVDRAEKHFEEVLSVPILVQAMGAYGPLFKKIPTGKFKYVRKKILFGKQKGKFKKVKEEIFEQEPIMVYNTSLMKEKTKVAEVVAAAHDKEAYGKVAAQKTPSVKFNFNFKKDESGRYDA